MIDRPSHLHLQLIKFAGQYSQWSDLRHLAVIGKDDAWFDLQGQGKSHQMD
jgi:hypothetical protein